MLPCAGTDRYTPDSEGKDVDEAKPKKPKTPKAPKAPKAVKSVEELVLHALKLAATSPKAKWSGTTAAALFNTKEANTEAAIAECTKTSSPLLKKEGAVGVLTPVGIAAVTKAEAAELPPTKRVAFLEDAIRRTPDDAAEFTPLLEAAVAEKAVELQAEAELTARRAAAAAANRAALERALEVMRQDHENELNAVRKQWEALGQKVTDLPVHAPRPEPEKEPTPKHERKPTTDGPEPRTPEEKDFRRSECDRLAAAWRDALTGGKLEGAEFLETAMWNIRGMRMIGETDAKVKFDGRIHESNGPAFTDYAVKVVRPGWLLKTDDEEYVALKATVTPV